MARECWGSGEGRSGAVDGGRYTVTVDRQQQIAALLADLESHRVERTQSMRDTDKFCEAICAFANDLPGTGLPGFLILGVSDKGEPVGAAITDELLRNLAGIRAEGNILPPPVMTVEKVSIGGNDLALVEVQPSDRPPVRYKGRTFVRTGPRRALATPEEERRLSERAVDRTRTWDLRPCPDATITDLSLDLFRLTYLPQAVSADVIAENRRTIEEQLSALRLFDLRRRQPTNAGVLLLGKDPLMFVPGAYVQYVRYDGNDQASRVQQDFRATGDLLTVLTQLDQLASRMADRHPVRQADLRDADAFGFPPLALRELFVNAVVHRNYDGSTTPVAINEYADRVEILNPGSLYGDLSRSQFPGGTSYRNPVLAEAAKTLGFVNRFGRGLPIVREELERNGSPAALLEPKESFFLAVVRRRA